jgi:plasmid maintenance system antidote protein VapI
MPRRANPHLPSQSPLIDYLLNRLELRSDAALSRAIGLPHPIVSRLRHGKCTVSAGILLKLHDTTGLPVEELRTYIVAPNDQVAS